MVTTNGLIRILEKSSKTPTNNNIMLQIISLSRTKECLRIAFDLDGNKCNEYSAIIAIFRSLVETSYGIKLNWDMRTAQTFGAWRTKPTEWIYWAEDGALEVADPCDGDEQAEEHKDPH